MRMAGKSNLNQYKYGGGNSMISYSEEAFRIFCKALMKSAIQMVRGYVEAMEIIRQSVGADRTGEEDWYKSMSFNWGPQFSQ